MSIACYHFSPPVGERRSVHFVIVALGLLIAATIDTVQAFDCDGNSDAGSLNFQVNPGEARTYAARECMFSGPTQATVAVGGRSGALNFRFENCQFGEGHFELLSGHFDQLTLTVVGGNGLPRFDGATVSNSNITVVRPATEEAASFGVTWRTSTLSNTAVRIAADPATRQLAKLPALLMTDMRFTEGSLLSFETVHMRTSFTKALEFRGVTAFENATLRMTDSLVGGTGDAITLTTPSGGAAGFNGPASLLHVINSSFSTTGCTFAANATLRFSKDVHGNTLEVTAASVPADVAMVPDMRLVIDPDCPGYHWNRDIVLPLENGGHVGGLSMRKANGVFVATRVNFTAKAMQMALTNSAYFINCHLPAGANVSTTGSVLVVRGADVDADFAKASTTASVRWLSTVAGGVHLQAPEIIIDKARIEGNGTTIRSTSGLLGIDTSWIGEGSVVDIVCPFEDQTPDIEISRSVIAGTRVRIYGQPNGRPLSLLRSAKVFANRIANASTFAFEHLRVATKTAVGGVWLLANIFEGDVSVTLRSCVCQSAGYDCFRLPDDGHDGSGDGVLSSVTISNVTASSLKATGYALYIMAQSVGIDDLRVNEGMFAVQSASAPFSPTTVTVRGGGVRYGGNLEHALPPTTALPTRFDRLLVTAAKFLQIDHGVWNTEHHLQLHLTSTFRCDACLVPANANVSSEATLRLTDGSVGDGSQLRGAAMWLKGCTATLRGVRVYSTGVASSTSIERCSFEESFIGVFSPKGFDLTACVVSNGSTVSVTGPYTGVGMPPADAVATTDYIVFTSEGSILRDSLLSVSGIVFANTPSSNTEASLRIFSCVIERSTVCVTNVTSVNGGEHLVIVSGNAAAVVDTSIRLVNVMQHSIGAAARYLFQSVKPLRGSTNVSLVNVTTSLLTVDVEFEAPHENALRVVGLHLPTVAQPGAFVRVDVPVFRIAAKVSIGHLSIFDMTVTGGVTECPYAANASGGAVWSWPEGTVTMDGGDWGNFCRHVRMHGLAMDAPLSLPRPFVAYTAATLRVTSMSDVRDAHFIAATSIANFDSVHLVDSSIRVVGTAASTTGAPALQFTAVSGVRCRIIIESDQKERYIRHLSLHIAPAGLVDSLIVVRNVTFGAPFGSPAILMEVGPLDGCAVVMENIAARTASTPLFQTANGAELRNTSLVVRNIDTDFSGVTAKLVDSNLTTLNTSLADAGLTSTMAGGASSIVVRGGTWPAGQATTLGGGSWLRFAGTVTRVRSSSWTFVNTVVGIIKVVEQRALWSFEWESTDAAVHTATQPNSGGSVDPCTQDDVRMAPAPGWFLSRVLEGAGSKTVAFKITTEPSNDAYIACAMSCAGIAAATAFDVWAFDGVAAGARSDSDTVLARVPAAFRDLVLLPTSALVPAVPEAHSGTTDLPSMRVTAADVGGCAVSDDGDSSAPTAAPLSATATLALQRSRTVNVSALPVTLPPSLPSASVSLTANDAAPTAAPPVAAVSGTLPNDGDGVSATRLITVAATVEIHTPRDTNSATATAVNDDDDAGAAAGEIRADHLAASDSRVPAAATGGVSVVAGAVGVSVTAPNKAGTTSRIVTAALRCGPDDAPDTDDDWPDWTSVVLVVPVGGPAEEASARAAGAALSTCALAAVASAALLLLHRQAAAAAESVSEETSAAAKCDDIDMDNNASQGGAAIPVEAAAAASAAGPQRHPWDGKGPEAPRIACARSKAWLRHAGVLYALAHSYYGPSAMEAAVYAAAHGSSAVQVGAGLACVAVRYAALLPAAVAVVRARPADGAAAPPVGSAAFAVFALFEPGRDHRVLSVRALILVDVAVADAVGVLTGLQPGTDAGCSATIYAILLVLLAACAYLGARRPYASGLEQWVMLGLTGLQAGLAAVVIARRRDAAGDDAVALVATAVDAATMLSIAALTADALWTAYRRRREAAAAATADRAGRMEDALLLGEVPTLAAGGEEAGGGGGGGAPAPVRNPLAVAGGSSNNNSAGASGAAEQAAVANPLRR